MSRRSLDQQGVQRALALVHRSIGRRLQRVDEQEYRLRERMRGRLEAGLRRQRATESRLRDFDPRPRFARNHRRLESARAAMSHVMRLDLARRTARTQSLAAKLSQLSPLRILERGYAIVTNEAGGIVTSSRAAPAGSAVDVRLAEGTLTARVTRSG
jgi:exodeoxyribonuclease VII large subunit